MQVLEIQGLGLECQTAGRLLPWIGPALRGMVAKTFKDAVCRHPVAERESRWTSCRGCPWMRECSYGQTFEPDPPPGSIVRHGQQDAARPVVLAPRFPLPKALQRGHVIPLGAVFIAGAIGAFEEVLQMLDRAGGTKGLHPCHDPHGGPRTQPRVQLRLMQTAQYERRMVQLSASDLEVDSAAVVPEVTVELTSPLAISVQNQISLTPRLVDLVAASTRVVSHLSSLYDRPPTADFRALQRLAENAPCLANDFRPFTQPIMSNRAQQKHVFRGVIGSCRYADVPVALLPWLVWGGRLHVGERRVAGAGGWRLHL